MGIPASGLPSGFVGETFSVKQYRFISDAKFDPTAANFDTLNVLVWAQDPVMGIAEEEFFEIEPLRLGLRFDRSFAVRWTIWVREIPEQLQACQEVPRQFGHDPTQGANRKKDF
jgi:hypothetical protein